MKKAIALILTVIMCLSAMGCAFTAFAAEPAYPIIYVHGFMCGDIYSGLGTEEEKKVMAPETQAIIDAVVLMLPEITELFITKDFTPFLDKLIPAATELVGDSFFDENGQAKDGTGRKPSAYTDKRILELYKAGKEIDFDYDWRYSPLELGRQLGEFIERVKSVTGRDKVCVTSHSYGNCVTMAYIALDDNNINNLDGYVCNASAYNGESYTGELFTGDCTFFGEAIVNFLKDNVFSGTEYEAIGNTFCDALDLLFVTDVVEGNAAYVMQQGKDRITKELLIKWFGFWPSIWSMVPDEMYADCKEYVFGNLLEGVDCSGLIAQLDEFDRVVRNRKTEIAQKAASLNHFGVISRYDRAKVPVTSNYKALTDNNIDVVYSSFGATCSAYDTTLPSGYTQAKYTDKNYISPDRMIDASTCMCPERTWFIKDMPHSDDCNDLTTLIHTILTTDGFTIESSERWPQFLVYDRTTGAITPYSGGDTSTDTTASVFIKFLEKIRNMIIKFLKSLGIVGDDFTSPFKF